MLQDFIIYQTALRHRLISSLLLHIIPEVSVHDRAVIRSLQFPGKYLIFTKFSDYDQQQTSILIVSKFIFILSKPTTSNILPLCKAENYSVTEITVHNRFGFFVTFNHDDNEITFIISIWSVDYYCHISYIPSKPSTHFHPLLPNSPMPYHAPHFLQEMRLVTYWLICLASFNNKLKVMMLHSDLSSSSFEWLITSLSSF